MLEKKEFIENNTTFLLNSVQKEHVVITCKICRYEKSARFTHIVRSPKYMCERCEENKKIKYIEENTNFIVDKINGENIIINCNTCKNNTTTTFTTIKKSSNYCCKYCINLEKINYIEQNTTFKVIKVNGDDVNIICRICESNKSAKYSHIKRSNNYECKNCKKIEQKNYIEKNTTFKVVNFDNNIEIQCKECGHVKSTRYSTIKQSPNYKCEMCVNDEKIKYIEENDRIKLTKPVNYINKYVKVTCIKCNVPNTIEFATLKQSKYTCSTCINNEKIKYIEENTTFKVNNCSGNEINITCTKCDNNKTVQFHHIKRASEYRCDVCEHNDKMKVVKSSNMKFIKKEMHNKRSYYKLLCNDCGHIYNYDYNNQMRFKNMIFCTNCNMQLSTQEFMIDQIIQEQNMIKNKDYHINYSNQKISELDFYFPEFNFAIEINGLAWHTIPGLKLINKKTGLPQGKPDSFKAKHRQKYEYCRDNGIFLLQITDCDVNNKFELVKSMILNKLGKTPNRIFARKCEIKFVSPTEATQFLENNHLQGAVGSRHKIGLYHNEKLISLMTFLKKGNEWDLNRFCNKVFYNVPGAFSKLLKYAVNELGLTNIISFSDNMYSDGSLYKNNGFTLDYDIPIDYKYTDKQFTGLFHKSNFMKSKIKVNPNLVFEEGLTEKELMELNEYSRYYDAGKIKWKYN